MVATETVEAVIENVPILSSAGPTSYQLDTNGVAKAVPDHATVANTVGSRLQPFLTLAGLRFIRGSIDLLKRTTVILQRKAHNAIPFPKRSFFYDEENNASLQTFSTPLVLCIVGFSAGGFLPTNTEYCRVSDCTIPLRYLLALTLSPFRARPFD